MGRLGLLLAAVWLSCNSAASAEVTFEVTLDPRIRGEAWTGRVYLFTSRQVPEPRTGPDWFTPEPFLARDVVDWQPGTPLSLTTDASDVLTFPKSLDVRRLTGARVQAVVRLNPVDRNVGTGAGNGFSAVAVVPPDGPVRLLVDRLVEPQPFIETEWTKLLRVPSALLTEFHGRNVELLASVTLPASYAHNPARRYPTVFIIPGFGGTHALGRQTEPVREQNERGVEFIRVMLDPSCPLGHHVFADSANNGPVGRALIEELIPAFDQTFRSIADPRARFLTGHSSGGWSSLWLQVTSPESFAGVWSTAPDPVDFRDFQRIDLTLPDVNLYVDDRGHRRPLAVRDGHVALWYDDFAWMEHVLGAGGQLHSFEAVFSPRGEDGKPRPLWDRQTGVVDPAVARTWEAYDIRLILERNWPALGPRLSGKLHVFMGSEDTFLLDGAVRLLQQSLQSLGSDAVVEIHEGHDHGSLMTRQLRDRIRREMTSRFLRDYPDWQPPVMPRAG